MTYLQIILLIFLLFAISRVLLRFRGGQLSPLEFMFWFVIFAGASIGIFIPGETSRVAKIVGIGRGVDLITYLSIAILFYLVFRIYVLIENLRHETTELVRKIALENEKKK